MYVRTLTDDEKRELDSAALSKDFTKRTRASIVLESSRGSSVGRTAASLRLNKHTVRLWIKRFNSEGMAGLESRPLPGRPQSITDLQKDAIMRAASTNPMNLGMNFTTWSLSSLKGYLERNRVVKRISCSWLREVLIKRGFDTSGARGGRSATTRTTIQR